MKISTFFMMMLSVGLIMFIIFLMIGEAETNYSLDINKSEWDGKYDFATDINDEIEPIKDSIDTITNEESGWLNRVGSGFTGIISAVTFIPSALWSVVKLVTALISGIGATFGLPAYIGLVFIIMISAWGIFKLIEFYQGKEI